MWLADLPSAGGKPPVWQVEQALATLSWVWFHRVGVQPLVLWQLLQLLAPTGMWLADLPVAELPLWQLAQLVLTLKLL